MTTSIVYNSEIYNSKVECKSREELEKLQIKRLNNTISIARKFSPFYIEKLTESFEISNLNDLKKLPFTTKEDLRLNNKKFLINNSIVRRIHTSSGSGGNPTISYYSYRDLEIWKLLMARVIIASGISVNDRINNSFGYGLFTGGLGFQGGCDKLGLFCIPSGNIDPQQQVRRLLDFDISGLFATPSAIFYLLEKTLENFSTKDFNVRTIITGGEFWADKLRTIFYVRFNSTLFDTYGLSEFYGPGVGFECGYHCGLHINEDHFYPEIINPNSNGEGELVLTSLNKEAMPLLRYRTGDITKLNYEKCLCGRTLVRMDRVKRKVNHLIFGTEHITITDIQEELFKNTVFPYFRIDNEKSTFEFEVKQGCEISLRNHHEVSLKHWLEDRANKTISVRSLDYKTLLRTMGKANYFVNNQD